MDTLALRPKARLSPAPPSRGLAIGATVSSLVLSVVVFLASKASLDQATTDDLRRFCWIFAAVSVALCLSVLYFALMGLKASRECDALAGQGRILESRFSADQARQDSFVAFGLCLTVLICFLLVDLVTMNDGLIQKTFLRFDLMLACLRDVAVAFAVNVTLAVTSQIIVMIFGLVLAVARMLPGRAGAPIRALAIGYIDLFRAIPAIIVLYLIGFGIPLANIPFVSNLPVEFFAVVALSATYSAYVAETYRSGIEAIHPSQWSAARSLGLSYTQTLRYVILPQAVRNVIPPLLSSFIGLQKDTALVNIIGTMDAFNQAKFYAASSFNLSSVTVVAVLFFVITIPQTRLVDWLLERKNKKG